MSSALHLCTPTKKCRGAWWLHVRGGSPVRVTKRVMHDARASGSLQMLLKECSNSTRLQTHQHNHSSSLLAHLVAKGSSSGRSLSGSLNIVSSSASPPAPPSSNSCSSLASCAASASASASRSPTLPPSRVSWVWVPWRTVKPRAAGEVGGKMI